MLLDQRTTREAAHPLELTAVNSTPKLVVHEGICRRLGAASSRYNSNTWTENLGGERNYALRQMRTKHRQICRRSRTLVDQHAEVTMMLGGLGPDDQITFAPHHHGWLRPCRLAPQRFPARYGATRLFSWQKQDPKQSTA